MDRNQLIAQVKSEYARLSSDESQQHFVQTTEDATPEAYYENLLNMVLDEISVGTFDSFRSGKDIIEAVANDKHKWLSQWEQKHSLV